MQRIERPVDGLRVKPRRGGDVRNTYDELTLVEQPHHGIPSIDTLPMRSRRGLLAKRTLLSPSQPLDGSFC
jgi:hypothetical protein